VVSRDKARIIAAIGRREELSYLHRLFFGTDIRGCAGLGRLAEAPWPLPGLPPHPPVRETGETWQEMRALAGHMAAGHEPVAARR
jgi:hypothetical protein